MKPLWALRQRIRKPTPGRCRPLSWPTKDLWGVGTKVSGRLAKLGINTVAELAASDPQDLVPAVGDGVAPFLTSADETLRGGTARRCPVRRWQS